MEDDDNWGLQAVVRSCGAAAAASSSSSSSSCCSSSSSAVVAGGWTGPFFRLPHSNPPFIKEEEVGVLGHHRHPAGLSSATTNDSDHPLGELEELFRPFFPRPAAHQDRPTTASPPRPPQPVAKETEDWATTSPPPSTLSPPPPFSTTPLFSAATVANMPGKQPLASRQQQPRPRRMCQALTSSKSKRRKNLVKKVVCQVPADALCSDIWAWRKYGQKPIKGSPFPRGYYRCSSSKGCPARKQVERSRTDPGMFVITYTSDHNHPVPTHRSCLAGSTRHKSPPAPPQSTATLPAPTPASGSCGGGGVKPSVSCSPLSSVEEELLLPVMPDEVALGVRGPALGADHGVVLDSDHDVDGEEQEDGFMLLGGGMDVDDMLGEDADGDSDGVLFSAAAAAAAGFCSPPSTPPPEGGVCSRRDEHGNALPFAAVSR